MNPRVKSVSAASGYKLNLVFTNGDEGVFDCSDMLGLGVFHELSDFGYFKQASVLDGTVVWPHEQDICPDTLYLDAVKTSTGGK